MFDFIARAIGRLVYIVVAGPVWIVFGGEWFERGIERFFKEDPRLIIMNSEEIDSTAPGRAFKVSGRAGGFFPWLAYLMGIAPSIDMIVTDKELRIDQRKFFKTNQSTSIVPLEHITTTDLRIQKPAWRLYAGGLVFINAVGLLLFGQFLPALGGLVLSGLFLIAYWWGREIIIGFSTGDLSDTYALIFKRHHFLIELFSRKNTLPYNRFVDVFDSINRQVMASHLAKSHTQKG